MKLTFTEYEECLKKNIEPNFKELAEDYISYENEINEFWKTNPSNYKQQKWERMMTDKHGHYAYCHLRRDFFDDGWLRWSEYVDGSILANRRTEWMRKIQTTIKILKMGLQELQPL